MTPTATLAGFPLEPPAAWTISYGVVPGRSTVRLELAAADAVVAAAGGFPVQLQLGAADIQQVWVISGAEPTEHPNRARVTIADQRWAWNRRKATGNFNVRRNTGERFYSGSGRLETADLLPREKYFAWSITSGGTPWDALGILARLLDELEAESIFDLSGDVPQVEVENLPLDGLPMDAAIARVLADYLPGLALYVRRDGVVVVTDTLDGSEAAALDALTPQWGSAEFPRLVNMAPQRPVAVRVLFDRRIEVPLLFSTSGASSTPVFDLVNVVPIPDPFLTVNGRELAGGTFAPLLGDFGVFAAWLDDTTNPWPDQANLRPTEGYARAHLASAFAFVRQAITSWTGPPNPTLGARLRAILRNYRLTMKPSDELIGRVSHMFLERLGIVDRGTGARGVPQVHADVTVRPTFFGLNQADEGRSQRQGAWIERGYSVRAEAPYRPVWQDQPSFVFRFDPRPDLFGEADEILPGVPVNDELPLSDWREANRSGKNVLALWAHVTLDPNWQALTTASVIQAAPNDRNRLHAVTIEAGDSRLAAVLRAGGAGGGGDPEAQAGGATPAYGPLVEVRLPSSAGIEAQFQWDGTTPGRQALANVFSDASASPPDNLLVNRSILQEVALAAAAAVYEPLLDRPRSASFRAALDPNAVPAGALRAVRHELDASGAQRSVASIPPPPRPFNLDRFLSPNTRKLLNRVGTGLQ